MSRRIKPPRQERQTGRVVVITDRDIELFILVGLNRYLSTDQVARALFPSLDAARRRCRALFDAGFIEVTLTSSTEPNLVSLTTEGLQAARRRHPALASRLARAGSIRQAGVPHHLAVVDARLYAAALGELRQTPLVEWAGPGSTLGAELGLNAYHLEPDGLAVFTSGVDRFTIAVEVDCGTEPASIIADKLGRYVGPAHARTLDALWVINAAGSRRVATLERAVEEADLGAWVRVISHDHIQVRPVLDLPARGAGGQSGSQTHKSVQQPPKPGAKSAGCGEMPVSERAADRGADRRGWR